MIYVLNNEPEEYKSQIEQLEKDMEDIAKPLMILKMKKELHNKYRKICKNNGYKAGKEKEKNDCTTLAMEGKFKGRCGKFGTGVISLCNVLRKVTMLKRLTIKTKIRIGKQEAR